MIYADMSPNQSFDLLRQVVKEGKGKWLSRAMIIEAAAAFHNSGRVQHGEVSGSKPRIRYTGNRVIHTTKD